MAAPPQAARDRTAEVIPEPARREQARRYARQRRWLLLADLALTAVLLLALLLSGASRWLRAGLETLIPHFFGLVAADVTVLVLAGAVVSLPLGYYSGFVLPHRYGLSVQTLGNWWADLGKGTLLGVVQAVVLALPVYALLRFLPAWWWVLAAVVITLFAVVLTQLTPVLIVPLFYKLKPLEDARLRARLETLAAQAGAPVCGVYVMDMSRRTRAANAAVMGLGRTLRIVLGDTLWQQFTPEEIEAVLAHELGHHVHHDLWKGIVFQGLLTFVALWLVNVVLRTSLAPLALAGLDDIAGLPLLLLLAGAIFTVLLPMTNSVSRRWEAAADHFAVRITGDAPAWQGALRKLADQNLAEVDPPAWVEWLLYSHPSIRHRLEAAERSALGQGVA